MVNLRYLVFDFSEDPDGVGSFDALASVGAGHWPALQAEVAQVLDWARRDWGEPSPVDEGGAWDAEVQETQEAEPVAGGVQTRYTLSLTLCGSPAFCAAVRERFGLDD